MAKKAATEKQQPNAGASKDVTEKLRKLVALAQSEDDGGNEEAARTAAMQACKLMAQNEVLVVSKSDYDRAKTLVGEAAEISRKAKQEKFQNMLIGAFLGKMFLPKLG